MAKYTESDYVSKLLPESLALFIIEDGLKLSEYSLLLHELWKDSNEYLYERRSEKEFILSVMAQIDYFCNTKEYHQDLQAINDNAITEKGKLNLACLDPNIGRHYNVNITRLYCNIRNSITMSIRDLFWRFMYQRRTKLALWYVDTVCKNFHIIITQNGKPVNLKTAKLDSTIDIKRSIN